METTYKPIDCGFHDQILDKASRRAYCKIQFFTELREFITVNAIIIDVYTQEGEEFMRLSSDEVIRLDRLVSINGQYAPAYSYIEDFTCDC